MTTDASVIPMDAKAAYPRPPRTVRLALIAAFATAVLAGPVTMALFLAGQAALGIYILGFTDVVDAITSIAELVMFSTLGGLVGSIPAAVVKTLLLAYLARRRRDASGLAIASGLALGLLVGAAIAVIVAMIDQRFDETGERALNVTMMLSLPFTVTGGLMGALHWRIAIRPRRRWRLFQERERAALLAME
jgi:MFS family permease